jgi:hypothetical protein
MISFKKFPFFFLFFILFFSACSYTFYNPFTGDPFPSGPAESPGPSPETTNEPTPEPAPGGLNDTPETAEPVILEGGAAQLTSDSTDASPSLTLSGDGGCCISSSAPGNDLFYSLFLDDGDTIEIYLTPESDWDPLLYMFTNASDPEESCVAGVDDGMSEDPESLIYTVPTGEGGTYIIAVDCYFSLLTPGGPFTMEIIVY